MRKRTTLERYADVIDICPCIYTRALGIANVNTKTVERTVSSGLTIKEKGPSDKTSYRKEVYWLHPTQKGLDFVSHVRAAVRLLGGES